MGKIQEKVVAKRLLQFCETSAKLHPGQMKAWKERCAIAALALLVHQVEQT